MASAGFRFSSRKLPAPLEQWQLRRQVAPFTHLHTAGRRAGGGLEADEIVAAIVSGSDQPEGSPGAPVGLSDAWTKPKAAIVADRGMIQTDGIGRRWDGERMIRHCG